ncbi:MAG TPA: alternative ribosome rescue aminoacyl-tRNA hydrolase ArfB [Actinomycetota bacterium]|nr:alternative ribosome rescue aminoacyl-tRNA hydrolase ArfB [Actinomycetota bacterium]
MSVRVNRSLTIPDDEVTLTFVPSGGPGGQHANKAATRAELTWNVRTSRVLGPQQRARLANQLAGRLDSTGTLRLTSDRYRSQLRNRIDAEERLARLVADALRPKKQRIGTKPTRASTERRLEQKRRRSATKKARRSSTEF